MPYYPTPSNITDLPKLIEYSNTVTSGIFSYFLVFALFLIIFIALKSYRTEEAFTASCFVTCIVSILLNIAGLVGVDLIIWTVVGLIASLFITLVKK